jgi:hypothetical protein
MATVSWRAAGSVIDVVSDYVRTLLLTIFGVKRRGCRKSGCPAKDSDFVEKQEQRGRLG